MKLTPLTSAFAAILGLALAGVPLIVQAQTQTTATPAASTTPAPTPASKPSSKPKKVEYEGTLTAVDPTASTITVTNKKSSKIIAVTSTTKIKKDKKPATLADFTVGAKVTGSYTADASGKLTASSLYTKTVVAKTAAKPATGTTPASAATPVANPAPATQ